MKKIECIIFDWAGTTVDYGCFAPVSAFIKAFADLDLNITIAEARGPMGMNKIDHIRELFQLETVSSQFQTVFGRKWNEDDVKAMNSRFESYLFASLKEYTDPIGDICGLVATLRSMGLKIGSTTGYTAEMMKIVAPAAREKGYAPDLYVTAEGLPGGRPYPYMIYRNMIELAVPATRSIVKVGDTIADIKEGVNANVWSVGVIIGSSEMGLTQQEIDALPAGEICKSMSAVRERMLAAGADYVIDSMAELPALIETIHNEMNR